MLKTVKNPIKVFQDMIKETMSTLKGIDVYVVTGVDYQNYRVNVKELNYNKSYNNVLVTGLSLGNGKGVYSLPNVNDVVIGAFIQNSETLVVLGTLFDVFSTEKDNILQIRKNELILAPKVNGSYIFIKEDGSIQIKNGSSVGLELTTDGSIKIGTYTFPKVDGTNGQVLKTNGSGVLSWSSDNT